MIFLFISNDNIKGITSNDPKQKKIQRNLEFYTPRLPFALSQNRIAQVMIMEYLSLSLDDFISNDNNNGIASNDPKDKKSQRNQELYTALQDLRWPHCVTKNSYFLSFPLTNAPTDFSHHTFGPTDFRRKRYVLVIVRDFQYEHRNPTHRILT